MPEVVPQSQPKSELYKFFNEATKYTVLAVFVLYSLGFIIWHSYLGSYGLSSVEFLQTEYLSAAFCYLFVLCGFALPPAILFERWISKNKKEEYSHTIPDLIFIWYLFSTRLLSSFFPDPNPSPIPDKFFYSGLIFICVYVIVLIVCSVKYQDTKTFKILKRINVPTVFLVIYAMLFLFLNHEVDKFFLIFSLILYVVLINAGGKDIRKLWGQTSAHFLFRILLLGITTLVLIANAERFGSSQFEKIPRQLGGGKPEMAFIKFSSQHPELAASFKLSTPADSDVPDAFVGPIAILLRTDKEIIFLNDKEINWSDYTTNEVPTGLLRTNVVELLVTNKSKIVTTFQTNVLNQFEAKTSKNNLKMTAKQIRADLVDAIIFSKSE